MPAETLAYIGLGSNLGDPAAQLERAVRALRRLPRSRPGRVSPCYRSRALGPQPQPDYLNAVAALHTRLDPHALLERLQRIERGAGRVRVQRWGPRTLDLDLLLYGELVLREPRLTLPHPQLAARAFVVFPLLDIAPDLVLPDGSTLAARAAALDPATLERVGA